MLKNRRNKGFSLIELMFAVVFLTVIVFGVVKLQTSNLALSNTQNSDLQAHFLANQGVEIVEAIGKTYIDTLTCTNPCEKKLNFASLKYTLTDVSSTPEQIGTMPYDRTIQIDATGLTDAYKVTSVIEWEDSTGNHKIDAKRIIY